MADDRTRADDVFGGGREPTAPLPPTDQPAAPASGQTAPMPAAEPLDATRVGQPFDAPAEEARWSASAAVPAPGSVPVRPPYEWVEADQVGEEDRGRAAWLTPVVVGLIVLLLLAMLGVGVWLIIKSRQGTTPAAAPTTAGVLSGVPSIVPTSAPAPTSAPPPTTAAAQAVVPPLAGLTEQRAREQLSRAGLRADVVYVADGAHRPGTVVTTEPGPGSAVAPNSVVRLIVAVAASRSASPSPTRSA
jgi:PASTA domain